MLSLSSTNRAIRVVTTVIALAACGAKHSGDQPGDGANGDGGGDDGGLTTDGAVDASTCGGPGFDVEPSTLQTISVPVGTTAPTVTFKATFDCFAANPGWGVDKGNIGSVAAGSNDTEVFTPTGTTGGLVTISADLNNQIVTRQILVTLTGSQNGPNSSAGETAQIPTTTGQLTSGGGVGGVGGEGLGTAVTDPPTMTALGSPPTSDGSALGLTFLYPYDKTVWPRGLLAPLVMWSWTPGDADAIKIDLKTSTGSFTWSGTFSRPAILTTRPFIRMPIPQDVWVMATNTAAGHLDQLTMSLTVAKNGVAYGPISETWTIAAARLDGTIYYQSYGTQIVQNFRRRRRR